MTFEPAVEMWRPLFDARGTDINTDFILDWGQRESGGNPCNLETSTGSDETGFLQLMTPHDLAAAGTSEDRTHPVPPCIAGRNSHATLADLTDEQAGWQVDDSISFINAMRDQAHAQLDAVGASWPEQSADFWSLVRLMHALPAAAGALQAAAASLGRAPSSWAEMRQFASQTPGYIGGWEHWLDVAEENGAWGAGGGGGMSKSWMLPIAAIAGLVVGALLYKRGTLRRAGVGV